MDPMFAAAGGLCDAYDRVDWAATTLGPVSSWGPALRSAVDLALRTRFAVTLLWGPQHVLVYNEAFVPMIAGKHPRALGSPARDVFAEIWDDIGPMLKQVSGGGGAIWVEDLRLDLRRHGFLEECYFTFSYSPVVGADGRIEGVIDIASETTPQILAHRRLDLLNRLNDHLAGVDHHSQVIERALPLLRDDPSDLPDVDIRPSDGELAGGDVSIRDTPAGKVATIGLSTVAGALGGLTLTTALSPRLIPDEPYLGFIRLVAATLTQALDRTRLREAEQRVNAIEREISETIQRSLLTPPPRTRDFEIAVRYQPAVELAQIGGDWYDSFLLDDGTLTVVVGDISGHDRHAAAAMAQVRNMLRGVTHTLRGPPSRILTAIDDAMFGLDINTFATVILAQIEREQIERDQRPGAPLRHLLRWSNAGHPAPILLGPDGTAQILQRPSQLLLGTGMTNTRSDHTVSVAPGSHVVFYTDGLIERRGEPIDQSQNALVETLSGLHHLSAEQLCDVLLASRPWTAAIDDIVVTVVHTGAAVD